MIFHALCTGWGYLPQYILLQLGGSPKSQNSYQNVVSSLSNFLFLIIVFLHQSFQTLHEINLVFTHSTIIPCSYTRLILFFHVMNSVCKWNVFECYEIASYSTMDSALPCPFRASGDAHKSPGRWQYARRCPHDARQGIQIWWINARPVSGPQKLGGARPPNATIICIVTTTAIAKKNCF